MKTPGFVSELLKTFSNKPSTLSSKRIERFVVFVVMLIASAYFLFKGIWFSQISAGDLMIVVAGWLGYAGFNTIQSRKDKKEESNDNTSTMQS